MRRTLILALVALITSVALCATATTMVSRAVTHADALRQSAERAARLGDLSGAAEQLRTLEQDWQRRARMLELVAAHDALSDIRGCISDARVCLENNNAPEFRRASAVLAAALERLRTAEAVRLMNLF